MLRFLKYLILVPIVIVLLAFAYANRHIVTVSFDPLASQGAAAISLSAPLFLVVIVSVMIGIVAGSVATWFGQGRNRRHARQFRFERDKMKAELDASKIRSSATSVARRA